MRVMPAGRQKGGGASCRGGRAPSSTSLCLEVHLKGTWKEGGREASACPPSSHFLPIRRLGTDSRVSCRVVNWGTGELASPASPNYMPQLPLGAPLRKDMRSGPTVGLPRHRPVTGVTVTWPSSTYLLSLRGQLGKGLLPLAPVQLKLAVSVGREGSAVKPTQPAGFPRTSLCSYVELSCCVKFTMTAPPSWPSSWTSPQALHPPPGPSQHLRLSFCSRDDETFPPGMEASSSRSQAYLDRDIIYFQQGLCQD